MNKDVIYIEPEDDITDIITKVNNAKEKIVALVPPKKSGVMRSIVNIKLIAKAGEKAEKTVVLVTTDPSIVKLAAATKLPVTKNLQSAPAVPEAEEAEEVEKSEEVTEEVVKTTEETEAESEDAEEDTEKDTEKSTEKDAKEDAEKEFEKDEKSKKKAKKGHGIFSAPTNPVLVWILNHKKVLSICGGIFAVLLVVGIWAFGIAPAATVTVDLRTTTSNFSENATFTTNLAEEDANAGKFYLTEKKSETKSEVEFEATGKKNIGQKASGEVVIYAYFKNEGAIPVNTGAVFEYDGLRFIAQKDVTLTFNSSTTCDNAGANPADIILSGCLVSARVPVVAENPGAKYNIGANDRGWTTAANVSVYSDKAMEGGTDETITVVSQEDVDAAKAKLKNSSESENKEKLISEIPEGNLAINGSFKQTVSEAESTPKVGEKVEEGKKAKLSVTTTDTIFYVDMTKIEEFIREKAKLADNYKIYSMNDPFVENFVKTEEIYTGKIKTSYVSGPEVTENSVIEVVKGKGVGTAQHDLSEINGIGKIRIDTSFPWVSSVPNNPEKITVIINVDSEEK